MVVDVLGDMLLKRQPAMREGEGICLLSGVFFHFHALQ